MPKNNETNGEWLIPLKQAEFLSVGGVWCVAVSEKTKIILIGCSDGIFVLDLETLAILKTLKTDSLFTPVSLTFSPDGKSFICSDESFDGGALLWDIDAGTYRNVLPRISGVGVDQYSFSYTDTNRVLAKARRDRYRFFLTADDRISNPDRYKTQLGYLNFDTGVVEDKWLLEEDYNKVDVLPGNKLLCASRSGECVDLYDGDRKELIKTFKVDFPVYTAKLSHNQQYLICSGDKNVVNVYDFKTARLIKQLPVSSDLVKDFSISRCNQYLAVAEYAVGDGNEGNLLYFDINSGQQLSKVACGKFLKYVNMDHANSILLTIDNNFVNLIKYQAGIPSLTKLCFDFVGGHLSLFKSAEDKFILGRFGFGVEGGEVKQEVKQPLSVERRNGGQW